jgi:hypothetical protein
MKSLYFIALLIMSLMVIGGCTKNNADELNNNSNDVNNSTNNNDSRVCTMDAKLCSDGTSVGRDPNNNCEFPACSDEKSYISKDPEQCKVVKFMCVQGKQPFSNETGCGCEPIPAPAPISGGKLKAYDCTERTQACTKEYVPVCGQVQPECFTTPCDIIMQTFSNKCVACANSLTISYTEGACANDVQK